MSHAPMNMPLPDCPPPVTDGIFLASMVTEG